MSSSSWRGAACSRCDRRRRSSRTSRRVATRQHGSRRRAADGGKNGCQRNVSGGRPGARGARAAGVVDGRPGRGAPQRRPASRSAARPGFWPAGVSGVIGRRSAPPIRPRRHRPFDRRRAGFAEEGSFAATAGASGSRWAHAASTGERGHAQLVHQARRDVGGDADVAVAAQQHQRDGGAVVAGVDGKPLGACLISHARALDVAGGFLDADHAGHRRSAARSLAACRRRCGRARCRAPSGCRRPRRSP